MAGDNAPLVAPAKPNRPRVGVLLRQSLGGEKSANQSDQLAELKGRYQTLCQRLKTVQKALKDRHAALLNTAQSRCSVAQAISTMCDDSPLEKTAGKSAENGASTKNSYAGIMMGSLERKTRKRADEFHSFAIDYVAQWEKAVTTRVNADMKQSEQLRRDADHYKSKVESLQQNVKKLSDNNKPVPDATSEKLERNEMKLQEANTMYNNAANDLFLLMDEVVDRSWRDLHPLLLKTLQWDVDMCEEEAEIMAPLKNLVSDMENLGRKESVQPRLGDMVDGTPGTLTTRTGGVDNVNLTFGGTDDVPEQAPSKRGFARQPSGSESD